MTAATLLFAAALSIGADGYENVTPITNLVTTHGMSLAAPSGEPLRYTDAAFLAEAWVERARVDEVGFTTSASNIKPKAAVRGGAWVSGLPSAFYWVGLAADKISHDRQGEYTGDCSYQDGRWTFVDPSLQLSGAYDEFANLCSTNNATSAELFSVMFGEPEPWVSRPASIPQSGGALDGADIAELYHALTNLTRAAVRKSGVSAVNIKDGMKPVFARWTRRGSDSSSPTWSETTTVATNAQWVLNLSASMSVSKRLYATTEGEDLTSGWGDSRECVYAPWDGTDNVTAYSVDFPDALRGRVANDDVAVFAEIRCSGNDKLTESKYFETSGATSNTNLVDESWVGVTLWRVPYSIAAYDPDRNRALVLLDQSLAWTRDSLLGGASSALGHPIPTEDEFAASVPTPAGLSSDQTYWAYSRSAYYAARILGFTVVVDNIVFRARVLGGD